MIKAIYLAVISEISRITATKPALNKRASNEERDKLCLNNSKHGITRFWTENKTLEWCL